MEFLLRIKVNIPLINQTHMMINLQTTGIKI